MESERVFFVAQLVSPWKTAEVLRCWSSLSLGLKHWSRWASWGFMGFMGGFWDLMDIRQPKKGTTWKFLAPICPKEILVHFKVQRKSFIHFKAQWNKDEKGQNDSVPLQKQCSLYWWDLGVSKNSGIPKWMVKIIENPIFQWMIWGGFRFSHYFWKHPFTEGVDVFLSVRLWNHPVDLFLGVNFWWESTRNWGDGWHGKSFRYSMHSWDEQYV